MWCVGALSVVICEEDAHCEQGAGERQSVPRATVGDFQNMVLFRLFFVECWTIFLWKLQDTVLC